MKLIENENSGIETLYSMNGVVSKITKREDGYYDILVLNIHISLHFIKQYEVLCVEELFTNIKIGDVLFFVYGDDEDKRVYLLAVKTNDSDKYYENYLTLVEYEDVRTQYITDKKSFREYNNVYSSENKLRSMCEYLYYDPAYIRFKETTDIFDPSPSFVTDFIFSLLLEEYSDSVDTNICNLNNSDIIFINSFYEVLINNLVIRNNVFDGISINYNTLLLNIIDIFGAYFRTKKKTVKQYSEKIMYNNSNHRLQQLIKNIL